MSKYKYESWKCHPAIQSSKLNASKIACNQIY